MKKFLIIGAMLVCMILGFTLPAELLEWKDAQRLWQVGQEKTEEVSMTYDLEMTFTEKIRFLQEDEVNTVELFEGKNFTEEKMIVHVKKELKELQTRGLIMINDSNLIYGVERILCQMDVRDGNRSMFMWELIVRTEGEEIHMLVDDETGKVLTIYHLQTYEAVKDSKTHIEMPVKELVEYTIDLEYAAKEWADYWNVELVTTDVYGFPVPRGNEDMQKEIDYLTEKGMPAANAQDVVYEEWGYAQEDLSDKRMYAVFEDEGGMAPMNFRKNTEEVRFMIDTAIDYGGEN